MSASPSFRKDVALALTSALLILALAGLIEKSALARDLIPDRAVMLKHAVAERLFSDRMPVSALLVDFETDNESDPLAAGKLLLFQGAGAALCFYIAALMADSLLAGTLAGALAVFFAAADLEQAVFACLLLAAMASGARRYGRETRANAALTGFLLGAGLLVRSASVILPFIFAAHEMAFTGGRPRDRALRALTLLLASFAFLAPWAAFNYIALSSFSPFESGRAYCNIVTGVLGSVYTIEGNYRGLAGLLPDQNVYAWALERITRAPWEYAAAVLRRVWHTLLMEPWLAAAAAAGTACAAAPKKAVLPLGLAAGLVFAYALMSIEPRYFQPVWLMLCCAAALPAGRLRFWRGAGERADFIFRAAAAGALCLVIFTEAVVVRALFWPRTPAAALSEAETGPGANPYLLRYGATRAFHSGDHVRLLFFTRAAAGAGLPAAAVTLELLGSAGEFPPIRGSWIKDQDLYAVKSLRQLELGQAKESLETLAQGHTLSAGQVRGLDYGVDHEIAEKLKAANKFRKGLVPEVLLYWPPEKRPALLSRLERLTPLSAEERLKAAGCLLAGGYRQRALKALDSARPDLTGADHFYRAIELYAAAGAGQKAAALFDGLAAPSAVAPGAAGYLLAAIAADRLESAVRRLARASGGAYEAVAGKFASDPAAAKCETLRLAASLPGEGDFIFRAAAAELGAGLKDAAAESASCTEQLGGAAEKARLAIILQDAGRPLEAALRLDALAESDARYRYDAGLAYALACDLPAAEKRFRDFLSEFPGDPGAESGLRAVGGFQKIACARRPVPRARAGRGISRER